MLYSSNVTPLLLAALLASQQGLSKPIEYTTRAKPIADVLIDLTKQTGVNLICTPDLENEPVILKFHQVPLKEAMDKIAYVFGGEWKQRDKEWQLERGKLADQLHAQALQDNATDFKDGVAQAAKTLKLDQPYTSQDASKQMAMLENSLSGQPTEESWAAVFEHTPASRLLVRILTRIDPKSVADMPNTHRIVFSNQPTSLQSALPDISKEIELYEQEQVPLTAQIDQAIQQHNGDVKWLPTGLRHLGKGTTDRVLVTVSGMNGRYDADIRIMDDAGRIIAIGSTDINFREASKNDWLTEVALTRGAKVYADLGPIAADILPNIDNVFNFRYPREETKSVLLKPTETDPLAIATSDVVLGLANQNNDNVAFLPPDDSDAWCYKVGRVGKITLAAFEQAAAFSNEMEITDDNGWLVGAPLDPLVTAQMRLPRPPLEALLKSVEVTRTVGIDDRARFECDASPHSTKTLADDAFYALHNWPYRNETTGKESCLALLGALSDQQRVAAATDLLRIPLSQLSDLQMSYLKEWVMGYSEHFSRPGEERRGGGDEQTLADYGEPTEVLAQSAPAYLEVSDRTTPSFSLKFSAEAKKFSYGSDMHNLGRLTAMIERPDLFPEWKGRKLNWISVGTERNVIVRCVVGDMDQVQTFTESHFKHPTDPTVTLDELLAQSSPEMKKQYTDGLQAARDEFAKQHP